MERLSVGLCRITDADRIRAPLWVARTVRVYCATVLEMLPPEMLPSEMLRPDMMPLEMLQPDMLPSETLQPEMLQPEML